jgi:hypothetical protein
MSILLRAFPRLVEKFYMFYSRKTSDNQIFFNLKLTMTQYDVIDGLLLMFFNSYINYKSSLKVF